MNNIENSLKKSKKLGATQKKSLLFIIIMICPAVYGIMRYLIINLNSITIAFTNPFGEFTLKYYSNLFVELSKSNSTIFLALQNTFKCFGVNLAKLFLAYIIGYYLYKKIFLYKAFRFVFFLPSLIAAIVNTTIFIKIFEPYGAIHQILGFNENFPSLFIDPKSIMSTILFYDLLFAGLGTNFLIILGAMSRIPIEYIEAAKIDGCNAWIEFWQIVSPLIWENFSTLLVLQLTTIFTASGPILYFTGGQGEPYTLSFWIFDKVRDNTYNYPAAVGLFFTLIGIPIVFTIRWIAKKINPEVTY